MSRRFLAGNSSCIVDVWDETEKQLLCIFHIYLCSFFLETKFSKNLTWLPINISNKLSKMTSKRGL